MVRSVIKYAIALCLLLEVGTGEGYAQPTNAAHRRFAERLASAAATGEIAGKNIEAFMHEEKIAMLEGSMGELLTLSRDTTSGMDVTLFEGKRYAVSFYSGDSRTVTISYPADYQLIMGVTMMEVEDRLAGNILGMPLLPAQPTPVSADFLQQVGTSPIYVLAGSSYMLPGLNSNRYYVREEDGSFVLLYSEDFPLETMANLTTGELSQSIDITVTLVKYGYRTETFTVPLRQLVAYCRAEGCTPYFGVISQEKDNVVCEVVMHNEELGYAHVMKLSFDPALLGSKNGVGTARMNSYIPLSNVKAMFGEGLQE